MKSKWKNDHVMTGCRGVLAATLLRAIADVREGNGYAKEAAYWIDSDRRDYPLAFVNVCESLDLDPSAVRKAARNGAWIR